MVKSHISACSWQLGRHSQIPNPKWSNPKSQMVKSQIPNGQIPNPKWPNPKSQMVKSQTIKSQISACRWQLGRHQRFSAATKSAAQTWRERERLATKFLLIYKSCSHLENISFDSLSLVLFFFSPSIIPRWVPRMNQMNFHEMQEKKEKAISLPPILNSVTNS